jgi:hypothetical protein
MDRRTYFKQIALASGGIIIAPNLLISCNDEPTISFSGKHTLEPLATFEEMRNAMRLSKGHLLEEMNRLIATKDAQLIFQFVKNSFATIPASGTSIYNAIHDTRWGKRGLLRSGKGTMREKSDLLFTMLQEAGFAPSYHRGSFPLNNEALNYVFCSDKLDNETITISDKYIEKWNNSLAENDVTTIGLNIENATENSKKLSQNILNNLPNNAHEELTDFNWLKTYNDELKTTEHLEVPIIRLSENQETKDLNLFENKKYSDFKLADIFKQTEKYLKLVAPKQELKMLLSYEGLTIDLHQ